MMTCRSEQDKLYVVSRINMYTMYTREKRHVYRPQPLCHKGLSVVCTHCTQKKYDTYIEKNIFLKMPPDFSQKMRPRA